MTEKTEQPSPRRLRKAREDGDVPVSHALSAAVALGASLLVLPWTAQRLMAELSQLVAQAARGQGLSLAGVLPAVLLTSLPLLLTASMVALCVGLLQSGASFSTQALLPRLDRLDLIQGIQRLFRLERFTQLLRALLGMCLCLFLAYRVLLSEAPSIAATLGRLDAALPVAGTLALRLLRQCWLIAAALAVFDVVIIRQQWLKRNRMTKDEVKREHRESEGDPNLKHERKRAHQDALDNVTVLSLRDADVLIVNPTHIAIGLRYDEELDPAPRVVAHGQDHVARAMIEAAHAYGIPVVRDVPIARALHELSLGDEIPEELFEAVAEILRGLWEQSEPGPQG